MHFATRTAVCCLALSALAAVDQFDAGNGTVAGAGFTVSGNFGPLRTTASGGGFVVRGGGLASVRVPAIQQLPSIAGTVGSTLAVSLGSGLGSSGTWTASGLPFGLAITGSTLGGTPQQVGTSNANLTFISDGGLRANYRLTVAIGQPAPAHIGILHGSSPVMASETLDGQQAGQGQQITYTVTNSGGTPLRLTLPVGLATSNATALISGIPAAVVLPGNSTTLTAWVVPSRAGLWSVTMTLRSDDPTAPQTTWTIGGSATASPAGSVASLVDGTRRLSEGQSATLPLRLSSRLSTALTVRLAMSSDTLGAGDVQIADAVIPAGSLAGSASISVGQLRVHGLRYATVRMVGVAMPDGSDASGLVDINGRGVTLEIHGSIPDTVPVAVLTPDDAGGPWEVGSAHRVAVTGGNGSSYDLGVSGLKAVVKAMPALDAPYDVDGSGKLVGGRFYEVTPLAAGALNLSGSDGRATASLSIQCTAPTVSMPSRGLPLTLSSARGATVWTAICPTTADGVARLLAAFTNRSDIEAQAFCYDSLTSEWVQLPKVPSGGLSPSQGVYIASRVNLGLDLGGGAPASDPVITLEPGWNLVAMPAFSRNGSAQTSVAWSDLDVRDQDGLILGTADQVPELVGQAYQWTGVAFTTETSLQVGSGYCIKNASAEPPRALTLTLHRSTSSTLAIRSLRTDRVRVADRDVGAPPVPGDLAGHVAVGGSAADGNGGCGLGGIASVVLVLALRRRR